MNKMCRLCAIGSAGSGLKCGRPDIDGAGRVEGHGLPAISVNLFEKMSGLPEDFTIHIGYRLAGAPVSLRRLGVGMSGLPGLGDQSAPEVSGLPAISPPIRGKSSG
jgi:hypothetical protein